MTDSTDVAMHTVAGTTMLNPYPRPSLAKAELAKLGIDASSIPSLFDWLTAHELRFYAGGPGKFWVKLSRPVYDEDGKLQSYEEIAHADGLTFGGALVVAVYAAVVTVPGLAEGQHE